MNCNASRPRQAVLCEGGAQTGASGQFFCATQIDWTSRPGPKTLWAECTLTEAKQRLDLHSFLLPSRVHIQNNFYAVPTSQEESHNPTPTPHQRMWQPCRLGRAELAVVDVDEKARLLPSVAFFAAICCVLYSRMLWETYRLRQPCRLSQAELAGDVDEKARLLCHLLHSSLQDVAGDAQIAATVQAGASGAGSRCR